MFNSSSSEATEEEHEDEHAEEHEEEDGEHERSEESRPDETGYNYLRYPNGTVGVRQKAVKNQQILSVTVPENVI